VRCGNLVIPADFKSTNNENDITNMKISIRLIRRLKITFFLLRADRLVPVRMLHFLAYLADLSGWIAHYKKSGFNDYHTFTYDYLKRESLYEYICKSQKLYSAVDYLEFGVSKGISFKWWIKRLTDENSRFYGFDTFTGLPEAWGPFNKGDMHNDNELPVIDDNRHTFYQGLFQQTLVLFLSQYKSDKKKVIHMDADLYSATLYVLTLITPVLRPGDIIIFDEFNVPLHEFKAFKEWTEAFYIKYKILGHVNNFSQTAFVLE
jgi:O-methyltransferase